jgi:hypothetical protein
MDYVCDAPDRKAWFRIETEAEAIQESTAMRHAVDKYFRRAEAAARGHYHSSATDTLERDIGLKLHLRQTMPMFLTLRDSEGNPLATAMLPPRGEDDPAFASIIVGPGNADPFINEGTAIEALGQHFRMMLSRERCYPYKR